MDRRTFLRRAAQPARPPAAAPVAAPLLADPLGEEGGLKAHNGRLTVADVAHLHRRAGFGATWDEIQADVDGRARQVVKALVENAKSAPLPPAPPWADTPEPTTNENGERDAYFTANRDWIKELRHGFLEQMYGGGLREKMVLFWHDHFSTEYPDYRRATYTYRYLNILRTHALGDFRQMLYEIGLTPAMLDYLNGDRNRKGAPNENYGREYYELMSMGITDKYGNPNYTEDDIKETARAFTGWVINKQTIAGEFKPNRHDDGDKTIFGRTGPWGYDDVLTITFEERGPQIADFICRKLYRFFVYEEPNQAIIDELAAKFMKRDQWDISVVVEELLRSSHFFSQAARGTRIKSPVELQLIALREAEYELDTRSYRAGTFRRAYNNARNLGQEVFNPPNVAGWPGYRDWISTTQLPKRWDLSERLLEGRYYDVPRQNLVGWARRVTNEATLPDVIVQAIIDVVLPAPVSDEAFQTLKIAFMSDIPEGQFIHGFWDWDMMEAPEQMINLMTEIYRLPEYQLA